MDVFVGVTVDVSVLVKVAVSVGLGIDVTVPSEVAVGTRNVVVRMSVGGNEVDVDVSVNATSKVAPTMIKFTELAATRIATTIRRAVILIQILLLHCMDDSYSSILGHSSVGQKSKIPF